VNVEFKAPKRPPSRHNHLDIVFRGRTAELLDALEEAFEHPYSGFEFRRKGEAQDLIDLILLRALLEDDLSRVRDACLQTFADRGTHDWPPTLKVPDAWSEPYRVDAEALDADLPDDVHAAGRSVTDFIAAINAIQ
jgi:hypothetical protein